MTPRRPGSRRRVLGAPGSTSAGYAPLDELLEHPRVRILRLLSRSEWLSSPEIADELLVDAAERGLFHSHLSRATAAGLLERRESVGYTARCTIREYAITSFGRVELAATLKRAELTIGAPGPDACVTCALRPARPTQRECAECIAETWRLPLRERDDHRRRLALLDEVAA